ncbi:hypothetical protein NUTIK01_31960 [Novosphingobium sp. IK01]|uniref:Uncharacterized protein n=1 Tax=Novosphingobium pituita TaxID=3056842 RepID=A0ABQ6PCG4_9SPHN|nr:hypothetical protein NUTIK01_31960 [Novosphingobium sp. IK01]
MRGGRFGLRIGGWGRPGVFEIEKHGILSGVVAFVVAGARARRRVYHERGPVRSSFEGKTGPFMLF